MPELDFALLCEHARAEGGMAHVIGAGIDTIHVPEAPIGVNLSMLLRVTYTRNECGRPHRIEVIYQDADGARIGQISGTNTPDWIEGLPASWRVGSMIAFNIGMPIPHFGEYSAEVILNDTSAKTLVFRVVELTEGQKQPRRSRVGVRGRAPLSMYPVHPPENARARCH